MRTANLNDIKQNNPPICSVHQKQFLEQNVMKMEMKPKLGNIIY